MIDFINVSKSFGAKDILKDASFKINAGEQLGIVGPNGAGKTTVFSLIRGEQSPDSGKIALPKNHRVAYLRQHLEVADTERSLVDFCADAIEEINHINARLKSIEQKLASGDCTHREKLLSLQGTLQHKLESLDAYKLHARAAETLCSLGFEPDSLSRQFGEFSGGWQMRASLARVLLSDPDILMLDEPSNYLDIPAIEWLCRFLRSFKGTMLLISHDRYLLRRLCTSILEINSGQVNRYNGDFDFYLREREQRVANMLSRQKNQDRKRDQLERSIQRFRSKSSKASQVQSWIRQLDRMEDVAQVDSLHYDGVINLPEAPPSGAETVSLEGIAFSYTPGVKVLDNIDLTINRGEKIALVGYNGAGKTTLLKLLGGFLAPDSGRRTLGHKVILGYQAQEFSELMGDDMTAYDVVRECVGEGTTVKSLRSVLGAFGFSGENADKKCSVLSGGEKIRLCFARIFVNPPNFLLLDEPTTHLDMAAREALQQALRDFKGSLCVVSHDIEFVRQVAETIVAVGEHGATRYYGNYDYYREKISSQGGQEQESSAVSDGNSRKIRRRERAEKLKGLQKSIAAIKKRVNSVEQKLGRCEAERDKLTEKLACGTYDGDFAALNRRLGELAVDIDSLSEEWEKSSLELEDLEQQKLLVLC